MRVRGTGRAAVAAVVAGVIGLAAVGCSSGSGSGDAADAALTVAAADHADVLSKLPAAVDGTKIVVGKKDAPHVVTVFVDPRCSYCAKFEGGSGTVLAEQAGQGKIKVEYVIASFLDGKTGGDASARAASAMRAAVDAGTGKFAAYQAAVFASQPEGESKDGFSTDHLLKIADTVPGLRGEAFDKAVRDNTYKTFAEGAEKTFQESGVGGTPTVLVDGKALTAGSGLYDAKQFSQALRDAGVA
ncbi:DsbA family protein [Streptomyces sp. NPDC090025]|uniref:DsbA family protein n=1 Tax=Streptomyces sp. NPDC090025 TaxID=3365922 RepID=UPI003835A295